MAQGQARYQALRQFGLSVDEAETVETLVASVPAEWQATLRMALVVGLGELSIDKPFQTVARGIINRHGQGV
jgi:hypothetical protein